MFLIKKNSILHLHSGKSVLKRLALDNFILSWSQLVVIIQPLTEIREIMKTISSYSKYYL